MLSRRPQGSGFALLLCLPAVVVCAGCGGHDPAEQPPEIIRAHVVLPEYPYAENEAIRIDALLLDDLATAFLAGGGDPSEVPRFFFSYLPLQAFDWLAVGGSGAPVEREALEGLLYLSGFFGGVWLKGVLDPGEGVPDKGATPDGFVCPAGPGPSADFATLLFSGLASFVDSLLKTARTGEAAALNRFLLDNLDAFILLYGYNRGYLQSILDQPPRGVVPPTGYLACGHFLDCRTPVPGITALEEVLPLVKNLEDPPDARWQRMANKVQAVGPQAVEMGYRVWTDFLGVDEMRPEDYQVLLDLSAGFLIYCQLLVLTSMDAWVNEDEGTAREAVALGAGMTAWVGGYGIGLISDYPVDRLPVMEVEGSPGVLPSRAERLRPHQGRANAF